MDARAHRMANALVGNDPDAATLEVTFAGPELVFEDDRAVAVCGADFIVTVGHRLAPTSQRFRVPGGGHLRFGGHSRGSRAYLAVEGGFAVDLVFGSRATHVPSRLGGHGGRPLIAGDRIPLGPAVARRASPSSPTRLVVPQGHARVRVLPSPHQERFAGDALERLQAAPFRIHPESDRMGYRLEGPHVRALSAGDLLSEPSPAGSVQVPPSGNPILLMADCQTTGGYPVVATVISADLGVTGQLGPGDSLAFVACTRQEAIAALIEQERSLMAIR
jgi:urea carboxylase